MNPINNPYSRAGNSSASSAFQRSQRASSQNPEHVNASHRTNDCYAPRVPSLFDNIFIDTGHGAPKDFREKIEAKFMALLANSNPELRERIRWKLNKIKTMPNGNDITIRFTKSAKPITLAVPDPKTTSSHVYGSIQNILANSDSRKIGKGSSSIIFINPDIGMQVNTLSNREKAMLPNKQQSYFIGKNIQDDSDSLFQHELTHAINNGWGLRSQTSEGEEDKTIGLNQWQTMKGTENDLRRVAGQMERTSHGSDALIHYADNIDDISPPEHHPYLNHAPHIDLE